MKDISQEVQLSRLFISFKQRDENKGVWGKEIRIGA